MLSAGIFCLAAILLLKYCFLQNHGKARLPLPPGPPGDFVIGHVRIIPQTHPWNTFKAWMKDFGEVIHIHAFGKPTVILNSFEAAKNLLDRRGAIYVDRPRLVLVQELMKLDTFLVFTRYGQRFLSVRKMIRQPFSANRATSFHPVHYSETLILLQNLLLEPGSCEKHIERAVSGSIMMTAYGHRIESSEDEFVRLAKDFTEELTNTGSAGTTLVDIFPILRFIPSWMPGAEFKRHAIKLRRLQREASSRPFQMVQNRRANGKSMSSVADKLLDDYEHNGDADAVKIDEIRDAVGMLYLAAVETTIGTIRTFILAMVTRPEVAKRAQKEIDDIIGNDRLPTFDDRSDLPYINCILKETYRWNPAVPLGLPHRAMQDDIYQGMHIPHGSDVIANIWAMMMNESLYEEPKLFKPERFFENGATSRVQRSGYTEYDPESKVFGFGRRICPGRFYADSSLWLTMACLLAAFEILPVIDDDGNAKTPAIEFTSGMTSQPVPFECRFVIRKPSYVSLISELVGEMVSSTNI